MTLCPSATLQERHWPRTIGRSRATFGRSHRRQPAETCPRAA